jgi:CheY-like chemotaxis protein
MAVKEKVLVVDDEPSIRKYWQTLLEVDGFDVEAVGSGKEALEKVNKGERPDFMITLRLRSTRINSFDPIHLRHQYIQDNPG